MELKTCQNCRKLFNYIGFGLPVCPACKDLLKDKFKQVKDYVWDHKGAGIQTVVRECDVSEKQIRQWIREERLEFAEGAAGIACESCGKSITSGRFCEDCKRQTLRDMKNISKSDAPLPASSKDSRDNPKMRFLG